MADSKNIEMTREQALKIVLAASHSWCEEIATRIIPAAPEQTVSACEQRMRNIQMAHEVLAA